MYDKAFRNSKQLGNKNYGLPRTITENRHDANFVVTGVTGDDKVGIVATLRFL